MPSILDPQKRRPPRSTATKVVDPLVGEIAEALLFFGGSAHRDRVINRLAAHRAIGNDLAVALRIRAVAVFDAHSGMDGYGLSKAALFRKPFGAGSHRWALMPEAEAFLRAGGAARDLEAQSSPSV